MTKPYLYRGIKYYPVCSFERNQHKIYYWYTKAQNEFYDTNSDESYNKIEEAQKMLDYFMFHERNGIVYAPYKDGQRIKEMIVCYDLCH